MNWKYETFQIPKDLLNEWREIGNKSSKKAQKHEKRFNDIGCNNFYKWFQCYNFVSWVLIK